MAPIAPLMRIKWPSTTPIRLDSPSDQSNPTTAEPRTHSMTSRTYRHTASLVATRKWTARAKSSLSGQENDEPQTKSTAVNTLEGSTSPNPGQKTVQKQKINISWPSIGETRSVKRRTSTSKKKNRLSIPVVRQKETANNAAASRPRRAAAVKAIKKSYENDLTIKPSREEGLRDDINVRMKVQCPSRLRRSRDCADRLPN